jgi:hypothetical protein
MPQTAPRHGRPLVDRLLVGPLRRLLTWRANADGRLVWAGIVAAYFAAVAAGRLVWGVDFWPSLGVPSGPSIFFDARNLTAAWECQRLGHDPLYDNPCDPWGRPLMYLRPWLLLGSLGLDQTHTSALAVVLIAALLVSLALLVRRVPSGAGIVLAIATCSPAVMFGVERANMDIAVFSLVAGSIVLWRLSPRPARVLSPAIVLLGATAKIYPVFALAAFVATRSRVAARAALVCLAVFAAYVVISFRDVAHAARIATQGDALSYGARVLPAQLYHLVGADRWAGPGIVKQLIAGVPLSALAAAVVVGVRRRFAQSTDRPAADPALLAFSAGALIYLGTFAVANNFNYRLVFLLLTLPQLFRLIVENPENPANPDLSPLAASTTVAILLLLWLGGLWRWANPWDDLASWAVAGLLVAMLSAILPTLESVRTSILGARVRPAAAPR